MLRHIPSLLEIDDSCRGNCNGHGSTQFVSTSPVGLCVATRGLVDLCTGGGIREVSERDDESSIFVAVGVG